MRFIGNQGSFEYHEFKLEDEFENRIYKYSSELFRSGRITRWAPTLYCELTGQGVRPDSLIVNLELDEWWVVEVELGRRKKIPDMIDQIGKLARVDYTKHREDIQRGLIDIGLDEKLAKKKARYFSAIQPHFMLILDSDNAEMISRAEDRNFVPLVVYAYKNDRGPIRLCLPKEHSLTREAPLDGGETIQLETPKPPKKPDLINGNWWYKVENTCSISNFDSIQINDGKGTFDCPINHIDDCSILQLPEHRDTILQIIKGNKVGILTEDKFEGQYNLKLRWT